MTGLIPDRIGSVGSVDVKRGVGQLSVQPDLYRALDAARGGAKEVTGVDASEEAIQMAERNADLNGFQILPKLRAEGKKYDLVILDPPAFAKSRANVRNATKGYTAINRDGMRLVREGGFLATCSCSHFMTRELFEKMLREAAREAHVRIRQVEERAQSPDHPVLWTAEESYYLKFYILQVIGSM